MTADPASYRDPSGHVHIIDGRIIRTVTAYGMDEYLAVRDSGALKGLVARGAVIDAQEVTDIRLPGVEAACLLEHPRLPFISYPYEWPFDALKSAALLHLDIQLELLEAGIALSDASAFNIQFRGARPVFIDYLSFRRYRDGEMWLAHRQFCEQFLNPLILQSSLGIPYHSWYRGQGDGIPAGDIAPLLKFRDRLSPVLFSHIVLPARLQRGADGFSGAAATAKKRGLPRARFRTILQQLRHFIARLEPRGVEQTTWSRYAKDNTYESSEAAAKRRFVQRFATQVQPSLLIDLGCNTGEYSAAALEAGARSVVGFDSDHGALRGAFARARDEKLNFLPLYQDLANPSSGLGWNGTERPALVQRLSANGLLALAVVHHLAIARNIPLPGVIQTMMGMAPEGVIEFIPKDDPTVRKMLLLREDIFPDYSRADFVRAIERNGRVIAAEVVSETGRELFHYKRPA